MAARKLQGEIDRTLKKVSEGVELFESIYEKMQASTNQTQKEKLETDLKTQIKKLQRLRDQIKTWVASNDIKDKSQLLDNRRLIETQMEKFKACEKEMKTKAFSKEGLIQASKLDPKAQEKLETTQWLQTKVEELLLQVETAEAEIESLQGGTKKKKGGSQSSRVEELEHLNERRKWHISRLEIVLRLLDNGSMAVDKVNTLKDDVSYFVESNTEEDFEEDEGIYDELNLDEEEEKFGLAVDDDDTDEDSDSESEDLPPRTPSKKHDEESVTSSKREEHSPVLKKANVALQLRKPSNAEVPKPPPPNFSSQPMSSILKNGLPQPSRPPAALPVGYAAAAAAAVSSGSSLPTASASAPSLTTVNAPSVTPPALPIPSPNVAPPAAPSIPPAPPTVPPPPRPLDQESRDPSSPSLTHPSVSAPSPMLSSVSGQQMEDSFHSTSQSPAISESVPASVGAPIAQSSPQRMVSVDRFVDSPAPDSPIAHKLQGASIDSLAATSRSLQQPPQQPEQQATQQPGTSPLPQQVQQFPSAATTHSSSTDSSPLPPASEQPHFPPGVKMPHGSEQTSFPTHVGQDQALRHASPAPSLPLTQYPSQMMPQQRVAPSGSASTAFPGSLSDLVASFENVKQKAPHRMTNLDQVHKLLEGGYSSMPQPQDTEKPKYYVPRNPYQSPPYYPQAPNPILSSPNLFSQLDIETLFYVFYYLPGTYAQYLAAKELKRQSWRFHVKYLTWFQRHSEPQAITEEYEQGVYVYFDWEGSWCQRKKSDFRFEYRYLSED
ncbi:hypothetical protein BD410DRAFT_736987 [Rickenella mellea]|uniref:General negative regulator of transcription subunit n=1 Tax=Rickenella mellea TaxID=50990 RepID=A0A4V3AZM9_9AGAM|nr:hypothetical protein BD410DRAFT_736987 [Rickenella mellea]